LPAAAIFEAVLIDAAIADAPALELGHFLLRPAGPAPFRFRIVYPDSAITPIGRYMVRATVWHGERLLYTTDTFHPVLTGGVSPPLVLRLVPVQASRRGPLGHLPASWRGELPGADGTTRWQIDQDPDGTFQRRQTFLDRAALTSVDDIGRWRLEPPGQRLVLQGGREAPVFLQPLAVGGDPAQARPGGVTDPLMRQRPAGPAGTYRAPTAPAGTVPLLG